MSYSKYSLFHGLHLLKLSMASCLVLAILIPAPVFSLAPHSTLNQTQKQNTGSVLDLSATSPLSLKKEEKEFALSDDFKLHEIFSRFDKTAVVIMAGGKGGRMGGNTCKTLIQAGDKTIYEWILKAVEEIGIKQVLTVVPAHNREWAEQIQAKDTSKYNVSVTYLVGAETNFMDSAILASRHLKQKGISQILLLMGDGIPDASLLAKSVLGSSNRALILAEGGGEYEATLSHNEYNEPNHLAGDLVKLTIHEKEKLFSSPVGWFFPADIVAQRKTSWETNDSAAHTNNVEDIMREELAGYKELPPWKVRVGRFDWINANFPEEAERLNTLMSDRYKKDGIITGGSFPRELIELIFDSNEFKLIQERIENSIYKSVDENHYLKIFNQSKEGGNRYQREKLYHKKYNPHPPGITFNDRFRFILTKNLADNHNSSENLYFDLQELLHGLDRDKDPLPGNLKEHRQSAFKAIAQSLIQTSNRFRCTTTGFIQENGSIAAPSQEPACWFKQVEEFCERLKGAGYTTPTKKPWVKFDPELKKRPLTVCHGDFNARNIILKLSKKNLSNIEIAGIIDGEWFQADPIDRDIACFLVSLLNEIYTLDSKDPQSLMTQSAQMWSLFFEELKKEDAQFLQKMESSLPFWLGFQFLLKAEEYEFFRKNSHQAAFNLEMAKFYFSKKKFNFSEIKMPKVSVANKYASFHNGSIREKALFLEQTKQKVTIKVYQGHYSQEYSIGNILSAPLHCYPHFYNDVIPLEENRYTFILVDEEGAILGILKGYIREADFYISYLHGVDSEATEEIFKTLLFQLKNFLASQKVNTISRVILPEDGSLAGELFSQYGFSKSHTYDKTIQNILYRVEVARDFTQGEAQIKGTKKTELVPLNVEWHGNPWPNEETHLNIPQQKPFYYSIRFNRPLREEDLKNVKVELWSNLNDTWAGIPMKIVHVNSEDRTYRFRTALYADRAFSYTYRVSMDRGKNWEWAMRPKDEDFKITLESEARQEKNPLPKIILFDLDNVLFQNRSNRYWENAAEILSKKYGCRLTGTKLKELIDDKQEVAVNLFAGTLDKEKYMNFVNDTLRDLGCEYKLTLSDFIEPLFQNHIGFPHLYDELSLLKKKGIHLGIISDRLQGDDKIWQSLLEKYYPKLFAHDLIFLSTNIGKSKKSKGIFGHVLQKIQQHYSQTKTSELLFIDDLQENVNAAREVGMQAEIFYLPTDVSLKTLPPIARVISSEQNPSPLEEDSQLIPITEPFEIAL